MFSVPYDTIRINKLTIFHNRFGDTIKYFRDWYKRYQGDTGGHLKFLRGRHRIGKITASDCLPNYHYHILFLINCMPYLPTVKIKRKDNGVFWYHGRSRLWARKNNRRQAAGKSYKYWAGQVVNITYVVTARISLK